MKTGASRRLASGIASIAVLLLFPACTTRIVSHPALGSAPARGIAYNLPATELTYRMTFRLTDCGGGIEITETALEHRVVPDRAVGTYLIDSSRFGSLSKTIPLAKITVEGGLLTGITYEAKDSTKDIIKSGATLVGEVVSAVLPVQLPSLGSALSLLTATRSLNQERMIRSFQFKGDIRTPGPRGVNVNLCNQTARDGLDEYRFLQGHLKDMKRNLYEAEAELAGKREGTTAKVRDLESIVKKTKDRLAELDAFLTLQYRVPIPVEAKKCDTFGDIAFNGAPFSRWFGDGEHSDVLTKQLAAWTAENKLSWTIGDCRPRPGDDGKETPPEGLYYRIPAQCRLEITKDAFVSTHSVELMQCGRLAALELRNGAFQDNSHRVEFDPVTGEIKMFEFRDNTARAAEALGGADEAAKKAASPGK
jgi:hypothetical protein